MEEILDFLIRSKKNTYANGNAAKVNSSRLGSKDYEYEETINNKKLCYHDTYFGGEKFIGCEVVYIDDKPIWAMNYNGYSVVENLSEEAMDNALRPALMQVGVDISVLFKSVKKLTSAFCTKKQVQFIQMCNCIFCFIVLNSPQSE